MHLKFSCLARCQILAKPNIFKQAGVPRLVSLTKEDIVTSTSTMKAFERASCWRQTFCALAKSRISPAPGWLINSCVMLLKDATHTYPYSHEAMRCLFRTKGIYQKAQSPVEVRPGASLASRSQKALTNCHCARMLYKRMHNDCFFKKLRIRMRS